VGGAFAQVAGVAGDPVRAAIAAHAAAVGHVGDALLGAHRAALLVGAAAGRDALAVGLAEAVGRRAAAPFGDTPSAAAGDLGGGVAALVEVAHGHAGVLAGAGHLAGAAAPLLGAHPG